MRKIIYAIACLLVALLFFSLGKACRPTPPAGRPVPDTVFVHRPATPIEVSRPEMPVEVKVYPADTITRKTAETKTIITSIRKKKQFLTVQKIEPGGRILEEKIDLTLPDITFTIDGQGNLELASNSHRKARRKKFFKRLGQGAAIGAAFLAGILIAQ
jgi:hypothetical protein